MRLLFIVCWLALGIACAGGGEGPVPGADPALDEVLARLEERAVQDPTPRRAALLVGVGSHGPGTPSAFTALEGCRNDVARMRELLTSRFGFGADDVFELVDEEATHEAIVTAFDRFLIRRATPGTQVVFYFSGHGSRVPDRSGDSAAEPDGLDSTYLAYDSRAEGRDGERDVTDDELRSLAGALGQRTSRIVMITDSCHSGGGLRGVSRLRARLVPPGGSALDEQWVDRYWPADVPRADDEPGSGGAVGYVHIAACRRDQAAYEIELGGGGGFDDDSDGGGTLVHGALTWFLSGCLERADPGATWRSIADAAGVLLSTEVPGQPLSYDGAVDREVFGGGFRRLPGFAAHPKGSDVIVEAGTLFGLREGSELTVLDGGGERRIGRARVEAVRPTRARCVWIEAPGEEARSALRAVEELRAAGEPPLRVSVADEGLEDDLNELVGDGALVELVEPERAEYVFAREDGRVLLRTSEGVSVASVTDGESGSPLHRLPLELREELRWRSLVGLANQRGSRPLGVSFRAPTGTEVARFDGSEHVEVLSRGEGDPDAAAGEVRVRGKWADAQGLALGVLEVTNPYDQGLWFGVVSVAEDRHRNLIHPAAGSYSMLPAHTTQQVYLGVVARHDWPLERPMRDRYLVFSTTKRADLSVFERKGLLRGADDAQLPPLLAQAAAAVPLARGGASTPVDPSGWGVSVLDLLVEQP